MDKWQGGLKCVIAAVTFGLLFMLSAVADASVPDSGYKAKLTPAPAINTTSAQDSNASGVWINGKYRVFTRSFHFGYQEGNTPEEAFTNPWISATITNRSASQGWVDIWSEAVLQPDPAVPNTLYMIAHNENKWDYYQTRMTLRPGDVWPRDGTATGCRIVLLKSVDGGNNWNIIGNILEDDPSKFIMSPKHTSNWFAGGVGDPSIVSDGAYLYIMYSENSYPTAYNSATYSAATEASIQGISMARILLSDLYSDNITTIQNGMKRWNGSAGFTGKAIDTASDPAIQSVPIPAFKQALPYSAMSQSGGRMSYAPSISYNTYLQAYSVLFWYVFKSGNPWLDHNYVAFNPDASLDPNDWEVPKKITNLNHYNQGFISFYPTAQPIGSSTAFHSARLDRKARLFTVPRFWDGYLHSNYFIHYVQPGDTFVEATNPKTAFATFSNGSNIGARAVDGNPATYWEGTLPAAGAEKPAIVYDRGSYGNVTNLVLTGLANIASIRVQVWDQDKNDAGDWTPDNADCTNLHQVNGSSISLPIHANVRYIRIVMNAYSGNPRIAEITDLASPVPVSANIVGLDKVGCLVDSPAAKAFVTVKATSQQNISVNKLNLYNESGANGTVRLGIYSDNSGNPGTLLAQTGDLTVINGWISGSIPSVSLSSGTVYWLVYKFSGSGNHPTYNQSGGSNNYKFIIQSTYGPLPSTSPTGLASASNINESFFASGSGLLGADTIGSQTDNPVPNAFVATKATSAQNVSVTKLNLYNANGANGTVRLGIYADNAGNPGALLAQTADLPVVNGWITGNIPSTVLTSGANYWLVYNFSSPGNHPRYHASGGNSYKFAGYAYGALPTTAPGGLTTISNVTESFFASN